MAFHWCGTELIQLALGTGNSECMVRHWRIFIPKKKRKKKNEKEKRESQNRSDMRDKESESVACTMHRIVYVRARPKNNHESIQFPPLFVFFFSTQLKIC